jgi:hypothetical protein
MSGLTWLTTLLHKNALWRQPVSAKPAPVHHVDEFSADTLRELQARQILMSKYPGLGCFYEAERVRHR